MNVLDDSIFVENQNEFLHTCNPCLKMEVFGDLDGFKFKFVPGIMKDANHHWKCVSCSFSIETMKSDQTLKTFYRKEMHQCVS